MSEPLLIVDGNHCLHRILSIPMFIDARTTQGQNFGGVYGFFQTLQKILDQFQPKVCVVVWDGGLSKRRVDLFPDYKHNRVNIKSDPERQAHWENFGWQRELLLALLPLAGVVSLLFRGREGDDLVWSVRDHARRCNLNPVAIVSEDNDFAQMVAPDTVLCQPIKDRIINHNNFESLMGLPLDRFLLYKSILGDAGDGIPGIQGVGETTAKRVAKEVFDTNWTTVESYCAGAKDKRTRSVASNMSVLMRNHDLVRLGAEILTPNEDLEIATVLTTSRKPLQDPHEIEVVFAEMEFKSILREFTRWWKPFGYLQ